MSVVTKRPKQAETEERVENYLGSVPVVDVERAVGPRVRLVHQTIYHDDGSQSDNYYLELREAEFVALAGKVGR